MLPLFVVLHVLSGPAAGPRAEVPQHSPTRAQAAQVQPSLDGPWQARQLACHSSRGAPCDDATLLVLQAVARAHWPEAWAYSALLADEANHQSDSHEAVKLAAAAYAMAPHRPAAQWAQVFALWRHRDWLPALAAAFQAVSALLGRSGHSVGVWVLPAYGAALTALMGFAALVFVLLAHAGPLLSHDIGHLLPKPLRPATTLVLAAISLGLWAVMGSPSAWGPVLTTTALAWPVVLYLSPSWRSRLATSSIILAATMLVLPHMLAPAGFVASAAGARFRALTDATAPWAQERLEPAHEAQGYDLWAQALLATRHLDGEGARALAERAISAGETHPALLVLEANLLWERKDFVRAKAFYEQALSQQPQDAVARYNLSQTLLSLADPRAAEVARLQAFADGGHVLTEQAARACRPPAARSTNTGRAATVVAPRASDGRGAIGLGCHGTVGCGHYGCALGAADAFGPCGSPWRNFPGVTGARLARQSHCGAAAHRPLQPVPRSELSPLCPKRVGGGPVRPVPTGRPRGRR